jgi:hypothetical protein
MRCSRGGVVSARIWIDVENQRNETLWNYTVSVARDEQNIQIEFQGFGLSGSDGPYKPDHPVRAGLTLPPIDGIQLAQALLIAAAAEGSFGKLILVAKPNSVQTLRMPNPSFLLGEALSLGTVHQIKFEGMKEG